MDASSYNGTTLPVDAKLDILHDMRMSAFERVLTILRASLARRIKKYTSLTRQSYGVMSASDCRFWRSPRMSVRQCLCRADNRPDSLNLQRAQGTVGARSPPIPESA
jgi:hypothetical protein